MFKKLSSRLNLSSLITLFVCVLANFSFAEQRPILHLAAYIEPPYSQFENGKFSGSNIELVRKLAELTEHDLRITQCPFARCLALLKKGHADIMVGIRKTQDREQFLRFIEPPFSVQKQPLHFFLTRESNINLTQFQELKPSTIGVLRGAKYFHEFDVGSTLIKVEAADHDQLTNLLLKNVLIRSLNEKSPSNLG